MTAAVRLANHPSAVRLASEVVGEVSGAGNMIIALLPRVARAPRQVVVETGPIQDGINHHQAAGMEEVDQAAGMEATNQMAGMEAAADRSPDKEVAGMEAASQGQTAHQAEGQHDKAEEGVEAGLEQGMWMPQVSLLRMDLAMSSCNSKWI